MKRLSIALTLAAFAAIFAANAEETASAERMLVEWAQPEGVKPKNWFEFSTVSATPQMVKHLGIDTNNFSRVVAEDVFPHLGGKSYAGLKLRIGQPVVYCFEEQITDFDQFSVAFVDSTNAVRAHGRIVSCASSFEAVRLFDHTTDMRSSAPAYIFFKRDKLYDGGIGEVCYWDEDAWRVHAELFLIRNGVFVELSRARSESGEVADIDLLALARALDEEICRCPARPEGLDREEGARKKKSTWQKLEETVIPLNDKHSHSSEQPDGVSVWFEGDPGCVRLGDSFSERIAITNNTADTLRLLAGCAVCGLCPTIKSNVWDFVLAPYACTNLELRIDAADYIPYTGGFNVAAFVDSEEWIKPWVHYHSAHIPVPETKVSNSPSEVKAGSEFLHLVAITNPLPMAIRNATLQSDVVFRRSDLPLEDRYTFRCPPVDIPAYSRVVITNMIPIAYPGQVFIHNCINTETINQINQGMTFTVEGNDRSRQIASNVDDTVRSLCSAKTVYELREALSKIDKSDTGKVLEYATLFLNVNGPDGVDGWFGNLEKLPNVHLHVPIRDNKERSAIILGFLLDIKEPAPRRTKDDVCMSPSQFFSLALEKKRNAHALESMVRKEEVCNAYESAHDGVSYSCTAGELAERLSALDPDDLDEKVRLAYDCLSVLILDASPLPSARHGELSTLPKGAVLDNRHERAAMTLEWMFGIREPLDLGSGKAVRTACVEYFERLEEMKRLGVEAHVGEKTDGEVSAYLRSCEKIIHNAIEQYKKELLVTSTNAAADAEGFLPLEEFASYFESIQTTPTNAVFTFKGSGVRYIMCGPNGCARIIDYGETVSLSASEKVKFVDKHLVLSLKGFTADGVSGFSVTVTQDHRSFGGGLKVKSARWTLPGMNWSASETDPVADAASKP